MIKKGEATVVRNAGSHYLLSELPRWELFPAVLRGKVRLEGSTATNPVAVGDHVSYSLEGEASELNPAVITEIQPRRNSSLAISALPEKQWNTPRASGNRPVTSRQSACASRS